MGRLTQEKLREVFDYSPDTGLFTKKSTGKSNWCKQAHGHMILKFEGFPYKVHRLIWFWVTGMWPLQHIDHIDGDPTNNKWENLRDVSCAENLANQRRSKSEDHGVYSYKGKWVVKFRRNNWTKHYGTFCTKEAAIAHAQEIKKQLPY